MDSAAFGAAMDFHNEIYEQEIRTYRDVLALFPEMGREYDPV